MKQRTYEELENELSKIRQEISELPIGYISKKTINGKTNQYLQWTENGKKQAFLALFLLLWHCFRANY